jgi:rhodanese-related sulfurtransferase
MRVPTLHADMDGEISTEEVRRLLADGEDEGLAVVDIRNPRAFRQGHIPGSVNVPFEQITGRVGEFEDAERIVTVCPHGRSSVQAAHLFNSYEGTADARVESMAGGLEAWSDDLVSGDAAESAPGSDESAQTGDERAPF